MLVAGLDTWLKPRAFVQRVSQFWVTGHRATNSGGEVGQPHSTRAHAYGRGRGRGGYREVRFSGGGGGGGGPTEPPKTGKGLH